MCPCSRSCSRASSPPVLARHRGCGGRTRCRRACGRCRCRCATCRRRRACWRSRTGRSCHSCRTCAYGAIDRARSGSGGCGVRCSTGDGRGSRIIAALIRHRRGPCGSSRRAARRVRAPASSEHSSNARPRREAQQIAAAHRFRIVVVVGRVRDAFVCLFLSCGPCSIALVAARIIARTWAVRNPRTGTRKTGIEPPRCQGKKCIHPEARRTRRKTKFPFPLGILGASVARFSRIFFAPSRFNLPPLLEVHACASRWRARRRRRREAR